MFFTYLAVEEDVGHMGFLFLFFKVSEGPALGPGHLGVVGAASLAASMVGAVSLAASMVGGVSECVTALSSGQLGGTAMLGLCSPSLSSCGGDSVELF